MLQQHSNRLDRLVHKSHDRIGLHCVSYGDFDFLDRTRGGSHDWDFHFHGFHDHDDFILLTLIANLHVDIENFANHWACHRRHMHSFGVATYKDVNELESGAFPSLHHRKEGWPSNQ